MWMSENLLLPEAEAAFRFYQKSILNPRRKHFPYSLMSAHCTIYCMALCSDGFQKKEVGIFLFSDRKYRHFFVQLYCTQESADKDPDNVNLFHNRNDRECDGTF